MVRAGARASGRSGGPAGLAPVPLAHHPMQRAADRSPAAGGGRHPVRRVGRVIRAAPADRLVVRRLDPLGPERSVGVRIPLGDELGVDGGQRVAAVGPLGTAALAAGQPLGALVDRRRPAVVAAVTAPVSHQVRARGERRRINARVGLAVPVAQDRRDVAQVEMSPTVCPAADRATPATRARSALCRIDAASGVPTQPVIPAMQTLTIWGG